MWTLGLKGLKGESLTNSRTRRNNSNAEKKIETITTMKKSVPGLKT